MEKIQLTQEQKDRIDFILRNWEPPVNSTIEEIVLRTHEHMWKETQNRCLNDLSLDTLARVLYTPDSYEVIPQYKVGDWVVYAHDNSIWEITKDTYNDGTHINLMNGNEIMNVVSANHLRHATPEEIAKEKKRRFWDKLGREVDEYKEGDIVSYRDLFTPLIDVEVNNCKVHFPSDSGRFDVPIEDVRLSIPVEQRLDK